MAFSPVKKASLSVDVGDVMGLARFFLAGGEAREWSVDCDTRSFGQEKSMSTIRAGSCCAQIEKSHSQELYYIEHHYDLP